MFATHIWFISILFFKSTQSFEYIPGQVTRRGVAYIAETTLDYEVINGYWVFQGDQVIGDEKNGLFGGERRRLTPRIDATNPANRYRKWVNGVIPYTIAVPLCSDVDFLDMLERAIEEFSQKTGLRWVPRSDEQDYVEFVKEVGCFATGIGEYIHASKQKISLWSRDCRDYGTFLHEMLHIAGFGHTHSREDRDAFIWVIEANIQPSKRIYFKKEDGHMFNDCGPYDYGSVMHYSLINMGGINIYQPTMRALRPIPYGIVIGQRDDFSQNDVDCVNLLYAQNEDRIGCTAEPVPRQCDYQPRTRYDPQRCSNTNVVNDCKDEQDTNSCIYWKRQQGGLCTDIVKKVCRKTCELCNISPETIFCKDEYPIDACTSWKNQGLCVIIYQLEIVNVWVPQRCKNTCGLCNSIDNINCNDYYSTHSCITWINSDRAGLCSDTMARSCRKTCGLCGPNFAAAGVIESSIGSQTKTENPKKIIALITILFLMVNLVWCYCLSKTLKRRKSCDYTEVNVNNDVDTN